MIWFTKYWKKNYVVYVPNSIYETRERNLTKREDLWEILRVNKPSQESMTTSQLEMEQFMRFPQAQQILIHFNGGSTTGLLHIS